MYAKDMSYVLVLALATLLFVSNVLSGDPCPPQKELAPCTCTYTKAREMVSVLFMNEVLPSSVTTPMPNTSLLSKSEGPSEQPMFRNSDPAVQSNSSLYTIVTCKAPKSQQVLEEVVVNALHRKWVDKLIISNVPPQKEHTLVRLPNEWLSNVRVKQFEIRDTIMSGDFIHYGNPFKGQEQSMVWFIATKCYLSGSLTYDTIGTTQTKGLTSLPRTEGVDFSRNHLVYISNMGFRYPSANLSAIILSYNSIQSLESSAFIHAVKLKYIDLSHNLLTGLARSMFQSPARYLEHMDFSWNHITTLPVDFFVNMPSLKIVSFKNNFLYTLPSKPWITPWSGLKFIELTGNFIECNCDLLWLLDILSPRKVNITTTPAPKPLLGQTILGSCSRTEPQLFSVQYKLMELQRKHLNCNV